MGRSETHGACSLQYADGGKRPAAPGIPRACVTAASMIDDRDIWRAAELLVERYGDGAGAEAEAEKRVDELLSRGDAEGGAVWRRIQEVVLGSTTPARQNGCPKGQ